MVHGRDESNWFVLLLVVTLCSLKTLSITAFTPVQYRQHAVWQYPPGRHGYVLPQIESNAYSHGNLEPHNTCCCNNDELDLQYIS